MDCNFELDIFISTKKKSVYIETFTDLLRKLQKNFY